MMLAVTVGLATTIAAVVHLPRLGLTTAERHIGAPARN